ncbi:hypothetical protein [Mycobacterium lepromatosis]|uniref:hypothetical protein n=1 Tax=Mycobacterium lepromatosis TaxID=480418 RepID=UPI000A6A266E|nr:hypothetical protein [Mycobacterium lepromatosis]
MSRRARNNIYDDLTSPNKSNMTKTSPTTSTISPAPAASSTNSATKIPGTLDGDVGHRAYPYYLFNVRMPLSTKTFKASQCQQIQIRFIKTGSNNTLRIAQSEAFDEGHAL